MRKQERRTRHGLPGNPAAGPLPLSMNRLLVERRFRPGGDGRSRPPAGATEEDALSDSSRQSGRWTLGPDAFERLLAALNPDRERAATAYEQLRYRIIGLLRWWG